MSDTNILVISGEVCSDPEMNARGHLSFRLCCRERYQARGESRERRHYLNVWLYSHDAAKRAKERVRKGSIVQVQGTLSVDEIQGEGRKVVDRYVAVRAYHFWVLRTVREASGSGREL